ncbi:MAG: hypothetical protein HLUCCA01_06135 [Bacteroidetes bacterium HLUCCA01]|nr:MAG: hypothetical protein HLUCCA01_06135 [Bacteroidetes bacterium HLUCCA01]
MKYIKSTLIAGALLATFSFTAQAEEAQQLGPLESYIVCAEGCVSRTLPWSWRRTACATDCYLEFIGEVGATVIQIFNSNK